MVFSTIKTKYSVRDASELYIKGFGQRRIKSLLSSSSKMQAITNDKYKHLKYSQLSFIQALWGSTDSK